MGPAEESGPADMVGQVPMMDSRRLRVVKDVIESKADHRTGDNYPGYSPLDQCPASAISNFKRAAPACAHALI